MLIEGGMQCGKFPLEKVIVPNFMIDVMFTGVKGRIANLMKTRLGK